MSRRTALAPGPDQHLGFGGDLCPHEVRRLNYRIKVFRKNEDRWCGHIAVHRDSDHVLLQFTPAAFQLDAQGHLELFRGDLSSRHDRNLRAGDQNIVLRAAVQQRQEG